MSIKIWCEHCKGKGDINIQTGWNDEYGFEYIINSDTCPHCSSRGYIEKGCENCRKTNFCHAQVRMQSIRYPGDGHKEITFCTAWEKKND